jgi:hypothetical protein
MRLLLLIVCFPFFLNGQSTSLLETFSSLFSSSKPDFIKENHIAKIYTLHYDDEIKADTIIKINDTEEKFKLAFVDTKSWAKNLYTENSKDLQNEGGIVNTYELDSKGRVMWMN